ncbi:MAG: flavodoxin [Clostridia bacterium]|nr:flavodoxin [Clostridia bacterium]
MNKTLVAYFSATGATKRLAERIAKTLEADIFEIKPAVEYTYEDLKWPSRDNRSCIEMKNKKFRPGVLNKLENSAEYDEIFLGFPVWYYTAPTIVNTFIEENNLEGKDIYIFVTSGVTSVERSLKDLKKTYPNISFISGKRFHGRFYEREVFNWLNEGVG